MNASRVFAVVAVFCLSGRSVGQETAPVQTAPVRSRFGSRVDLGGTFGATANLTQLNGPVTGQQFRINPGIQFDLAAGYWITPWLEVEGEFGMVFNTVDSIGSWSPPDTSLFQMPLMANLVIQYPRGGRFEPYVGAGVGGVASFLTFGDPYSWYAPPEGSGATFPFAVQAFGGLRYRFDDHWSFGVAYRFLAVQHQEWDVDWEYGPNFTVAVDSLHMHSVCFVFAGRF